MTLKEALTLSLILCDTGFLGAEFLERAEKVRYLSQDHAPFADVLLG